MCSSVALLLTVCLGPLAEPQSPFVFREVSPTGLELSDRGKPVFVYNFGMILPAGFPEAMRRSSYLHPVYAPDGTVLTDDFNPDHAHTGTFQGRPAGARIEDVASNPGYPNNGWLMRHGFGFLNVSYPGLEPITLEPGQPLVLKYRVILFAGTLAP